MADDMRDMVEKGRNNPSRGEEHVSAKLDEEKVRAIRASDETQQVLADRYGVDRSLISEVKSRKRWKHIYAEVTNAS
jgi:hypothetical protein